MYQPPPSPDHSKTLYAVIAALIAALTGGGVYAVPKVVGANDETRVAQGQAVIQAAESIREVEQRLNAKIDALSEQLNQVRSDNAELRGTIKSLEKQLR